jgi:ribosomal protein S12 methylthiotransferase accessory factor
MTTRKELRARMAQYLNGLTREDLFGRFGITRTARIDTLDHLGVPVYSSVRPAARVISVSAGKSLDRDLARAGAVAEAIEFATFENPLTDFWVTPLVRGDLSTCADSEWTTEMPIAVEHVTSWTYGSEVLLPSDLVWLVKREGQEQHFMRGSNGQALGVTFEDAFCQGLLECVERDQVTLRRLSLERLGVYPPALDLRSAVPPAIQELCERVNAGGLKLYLFFCTCDIPLPTFWALLLDRNYVNFAGWGTAVTNDEAARRAILEAIQSRAVYIRGARDDIERKKFMNLNGIDTVEMIREVEGLPKIKWNIGVERNGTVEEELLFVLNALGSWRDQIYYKHIDLGDMHAVKAIVLGLEQPMLPRWRSMRWDQLYADNFCGAKLVRPVS